MVGIGVPWEFDNKSILGRCIMKLQLVWITLNHICNLSCKWCYQREVARSGKKMSIQLAKDLVDLCRNLSVGIVVLIGGEPTLHEGFCDIIKYIKEKGMTASVVTNGIRFSSERFLADAETSGLDEIVFSVKGSSKEEYIESAGADSFDLARKAIKNIAASKMRHRISVTVSSPVIENWASWVSFVKDCEIKEINFSFEKPVILSDKIAYDERMMTGNVARFIEDTMYPSLLTTDVDFKLEFMYPQCGLSRDFIAKLEEEGHAFGGCTVMRESGIAFDPEGRVLPCNHFVDYYLAQFGKDFNTAEEFDRLFTVEETQQFYQMIKQAPCQKCAECDRWSKCGGGCRIFWLYQGAEKLIPNSSHEAGLVNL